MLAGVLLAGWLGALIYSASVPEGARSYFLDSGAGGFSHTQAFTTLVLFAVYLCFRFLIRRDDTGFWSSKPTRIVVGAVGWGTVISVVCYTGETLLPIFTELPVVVQDAVGVSMVVMLHLTGATIVILAGTALWLALENLNDDSTRFRRLAGALLAPRCMYAVVGISGLLSIAVAFGGVAGFIPFETLDLRADLSAYGHLYRILATGFVGLYAGLLAVVLHIASVTGANGDEFRRRWKYLSYALTGLAFLELHMLFVPVLADLRPGTLLAANPGVLDRLGGLPGFAIIGWGVFGGFAGRRSSSVSGRRWHYVERYKTLLEDLEQRILSLEPRHLEDRIEQDRLRNRTLLRYLADASPEEISTEEIERARMTLSLLGLGLHPIHGRNLASKLYLLQFFQRCFLTHSRPNTDTYRRAYNDRLAPVAEATWLLLRQPSDAPLPPSLPLYAKVAYRMLAESHLLKPSP